MCGKAGVEFRIWDYAYKQAGYAIWEKTGNSDRVPPETENLFQNVRIRAKLLIMRKLFIEITLSYRALYSCYFQYFSAELGKIMRLPEISQNCYL